MSGAAGREHEGPPPRPERRALLRALATAPALAAGGPALWAAACSGGDERPYTEADAAALAEQRRAERERSGQGPYGPLRFRGYRGLAELPGFELDRDGRLVCTVEGLPPTVDFHAHLGMSLLLAPELDLTAATPRVRHLLDCDAEEPGCELDLDVYANANFGDADLWALRRGAVAQMLWGSSAAATHTIPNLLAEMEATRVAEAVLHPIAFGLPFGDDLDVRWRRAVGEAGRGDRLHVGASVHPRDPDRLRDLRRQARAGARVVKLHPPMQRFYADAPEAMEIYEECGRLGLTVFFHAGRAGIEPSFSHPYGLMRHYEAALAEHPDVRFVLGHAGARDVADAVPLARRYHNAWMGTHGQGVTVLHDMLGELGPSKLVFGSDWPFYHVAMSLAKVLMVTRERPAWRVPILSGNARGLLGPA